MTVESFKQFATEHNYFEIIKSRNVYFKVKPSVKTTGWLDIIRKVFPNNYVKREGKQFTIYHGDKETMKMLNTTIHFYNSSDVKKELKEEINKLKR